MMFQKKSLGQNFLRSASALKAIVDAGNISPGETILEIGPGEGTLTRELLSRGAKVIAVEKDDRLIPLLQQKFSKETASKRLALIHGDILDFDASMFGSQPYKIIANIPYYITGAILKKFFGAEKQPERIVLLVQKEVADRIVARDGKESILSTSVKVYGNPSIVQKIPRGAFTPAPNVDSAILAVTDISKKFFGGDNEQSFFELVRRGFKSKRKKLSNNLGWEKTAVQEIFQSIGLESNARAEELSIDDWKKLWRTGESLKI